MNPRSRVTEVSVTGSMATVAEASAYLGGINTTDTGQAALLDMVMAAAHDYVDGWDTRFGWCFRVRTLRLDVELGDGECVILPGGASAVTGATLDGTASTAYDTDIDDAGQTVVTVEADGEWRITYTVGDSTVPELAKLAFLRLVGTFWAERRAVLDSAAMEDAAHMLRRWTVRSGWE